jgi:hypothetical protein
MKANQLYYKIQDCFDLIKNTLESSFIDYEISFPTGYICLITFKHNNKEHKLKIEALSGGNLILSTNLYRETIFIESLSCFISGYVACLFQFL